MLQKGTKCQFKPKMSTNFIQLSNTIYWELSYTKQ